jgi:hypothetical protein
MMVQQYNVETMNTATRAMRATFFEGKLVLA